MGAESCPVPRVQHVGPHVALLYPPVNDRPNYKGAKVAKFLGR